MSEVILDARQPDYIHHTYQLPVDCPFSVCIGVLSHPQRRSIKSFCLPHSSLTADVRLFSIYITFPNVTSAWLHIKPWEVLVFFCYQPTCTQTDSSAVWVQNICKELLSAGQLSVQFCFLNVCLKLCIDTKLGCYKQRRRGNTTQDWKKVKYLKTHKNLNNEVVCE